MTWTVEQLKSHMDDMMYERDRRYTERWEAQQIALAASADAFEHRLDSMNEFRAQLSDQAATFVTRETFEAGMAQAAAGRDSIHTRLNEINRRLDRAEGQGSGREQLWGYVLGAVGGSAGVIGVVLALVSR